jgi:MFS family permease
VVLTPSVMPAGASRRGSIDLAGATTVTVGLAAIVFAVVRAPEAGWTSASTLVAGLAGLALVAVFVALQARLQQPLVRLGIFKAPNLAAANTAQFMLGAAWIPMFFFVNLYLQQVIGLGAFASGAALLPLTITIMVGMIAVAPRLIARFGPKAMTVAGLATLAGGLAWLSFVRDDGSFLVDVLPSMVVLGLGVGTAMNPVLLAAMSDVPPEQAGLASGVVNTAFMMGGALGLAVLASLAASRSESLTADGSAPIEALTGGYHASFVIGAVFAGAAAALGALLLRTRAERHEALVPATAEADC